MEWLRGKRPSTREKDLEYNFIGATVLEPKDTGQIEVNLFLKPTENDEVLIVKGATKSLIELPKMCKFPEKYIVSRDYYDDETEIKEALEKKPADFITLFFIHNRRKNIVTVRIGTLGAFGINSRYIKWEEFKTTSDLYALSSEEYAIFEEASDDNKKKQIDSDLEKENQFNPEFDHQGSCNTVNKDAVQKLEIHKGKITQNLLPEEVIQTKPVDLSMCNHNNNDQNSKDNLDSMEGILTQTSTEISDIEMEDVTATQDIVEQKDKDHLIDLDNYKILPKVFGNTSLTIQYIEALFQCKEKLQTSEEDHILIKTINEGIRDLHFFKRFYGRHDEKPQYIEVFENLVGGFIQQYKDKHEIDFNIGIDNIRKIRKNVRIIFAWKALRSFNLNELDGRSLANRIIHINWLLFERGERPSKADFNFDRIREYCNRVAKVEKRQLPMDFSKLPQKIFDGLPHIVPIKNRQTIKEIVAFLRQYYDFDRLPESYFVPKPVLPENWQNLRSEVRNLFPITDPRKLKNLNAIRFQLKAYYQIPEKLPDYYFNLPIKKSQKPNLPENPEDISLNCNKYLPWKRGGTEDYSFKDLIRELGTHYNFEKLPENYFYQRTKLPNSPKQIQIPQEIKVPATCIVEARELSRFLYPLYEYEVPLGKQWINYELDKRIPLPEDMKVAEAGSGIKLPIRRINLKTEIKKLRKYYKFKLLPDKWIVSDYVRKPLLPDLETTIKDLQEKYGNRQDWKIDLPIKTQKQYNETVNVLKTYYFFRYLPKEFVEMEKLPEPDFPAVGNLIFV